MAEKQAQRISVVLPPDIAEALEALATERQTTITDVVRRAIATESFIAKETKTSDVILQDKQDSSKQRLIVFRPV